MAFTKSNGSGFRRVGKVLGMGGMVSILALTAALPAHAEGVDNDDEIVVTARKRNESVMKTPVIMEAIGTEKIKDLKIENFEDLGQVSPGLQIAPAYGTVGMYVYFRGLGNGGGANFADQAVQLNVDGIATTHGAFYRSGMFDVGQIEILKGPQALFFGKSSSAGIIAISSADPTPDWESKITAGYEFDADEMSADAYIAGPITDKLGIRLAGFYATREGWLRNVDPVAHRRVPDGTDYGGRVTLKYDDADAGLRMKAKYANTRRRSDMWAGDVGQRVCYGSTPVNFGWPDDCVLSRITQSSPYGQPYNPDVDWYSPTTLGDYAAFATGSSDPLYRNGRGYTYTNTQQASLQVDYDVSSGLTLTSVSGWSKLETVDTGVAWTAFSPDFATTFQLGGQYNQKDYSQELRLTSDWNDSWINFIIGGYFNANTAKNYTAANFPALTTVWNTSAKIKTDTYSAFGQVLLTPIDKLEVAAGVRYTKVKKELASLTYRTNALQDVPGVVGEIVPYLPDDIHKKTENNTSPEFTLTYRPNDDLTTFVSYKWGYKAPGTNVNFFSAVYVPGQVGYFNGEKVKGVEGGIKAALLDRRLKLTLSAYNYKYKDLQVVFSLGAEYTTTVANGANARIRGVELGASFAPPGIEGLNLNVNVNFNDSKYTDFQNAPCYAGQYLLGITCTDADPLLGFLGSQDLSGHRLAHAPKWTGQLGIDYKTEVSKDHSVALNLNSNFSSSYDNVDQINPTGFQKSWITFDAALRFGALNGPWEVGVLVRNITNKYYIASAADDGLSFTTPGDSLVYMNRPRQVMLQLTFRPDQFTSK